MFRHDDDESGRLHEGEHLDIGDVVTWPAPGPTGYRRRGFVTARWRRPSDMAHCVVVLDPEDGQERSFHASDCELVERAVVPL